MLPLPRRPEQISDSPPRHNYKSWYCLGRRCLSAYAPGHHKYKSLGQVGFNAVIGGAESALQDKVYGRNIDWKQVGISAGIGALAGRLGGRGATAPIRTVYGKIVGAGGVNTSVVYVTYASRKTAEAAAKSLARGLAKGSLTQIIVTNKVVKIIYKE